MSEPLAGLMMNDQLLVASIIDHAEQNFSDREIVSFDTNDEPFRYTYGGLHQRSRRLAKWLKRAGVKRGDRVATLGLNTHRHLELYYAVPGIGAVCHTVNPRLSSDEISYIVNHAEDGLIFVDPAFVPVLERDYPGFGRSIPIVVMCAADRQPSSDQLEMLNYEDCLAEVDDDLEWTSLSEGEAAGLCYTSGTTGRPKGVLYSHRSTVLHAMGSALPNALSLANTDVLLPVVPMFHVNAWGMPYTAALVGAKLVMPGMHLAGARLTTIFNDEGVTFAAGVPTIWHGLTQHLQTSGEKLKTIQRFVVGGSALPATMIEYFEREHGIDMLQGWGMTETSPLCTISSERHGDADQPFESRVHQKAAQGWSLFGASVKIVDEAGADLPRDGKSAGELMVRGPWVCSDYFKYEGSAPLRDGWFPTGDIATIDNKGVMRITDRVKDLIKSGGEWISSIELENLALTYPAVSQATVISRDHPQWGERPLLIIVEAEGQRVDHADLLAMMERHLDRWKVPQEVTVIDALPIGATGKILKTKLREMFADFVFAS